MNGIVFFDLTLFELSYMFIFWSIIGWLLEVAIRTVETGKFESRGMLSGPYCPIYGFGVVFVVIGSRPIQDNAWLLFFVSMTICTLLELFVGVMLEKLFDAQWWSYADYKYNYKGYIALKASLFWGFGCLIVVRIAHPAMLNLIQHIPYKIGVIILAVVFAVIFCDSYQTVSSLLKFKRRLAQLEKLQAKLFDATNAVGENFSDEIIEIRGKYEKVVESTKEKSNAIKEKSNALIESTKVKSNALIESTKEKSSALIESTKEKSAAIREKVGANKYSEEIAELRQKYDTLLESTRIKAERFLKAFPDMSSRKKPNALDAVKERFNKARNKKK